MIRIATLAVVSLPCLTAAQVTVEYTDLAGTAILLEMHQVTSPGSATVPSDGINQTWDLSTITLQEIGTLDFAPAAGTPYASTYPTANWVWHQMITGVGSNYMYLDIGTSGIEVVASDVPAAPNVYTDNKYVMQFPLAYGQSFTDAYTDNDGPTSVTWSYTGHGTLLSPLGTFTDQVKMVSDEGDVVIWNTAPLHPTVIDDGSGLVLVFLPAGVGIGEGTGASSMRVHPNPCEGQLNVQGATAGERWCVTDLQGRAVLAGTFAAPNSSSIGTDALAPGSYLLVVGDASRTRAVRFTKE